MNKISNQSMINSQIKNMNMKGIKRIEKNDLNLNDNTPYDNEEIVKYEFNDFKDRFPFSRNLNLFKNTINLHQKNKSAALQNYIDSYKHMKIILPKERSSKRCKSDKNINEKGIIKVHGQYENLNQSQINFQDSKIMKTSNKIIKKYKKKEKSKLKFLQLISKQEFMNKSNLGLKISEMYFSPYTSDLNRQFLNDLFRVRLNQTKLDKLPLLPKRNKLLQKSFPYLSAKSRFNVQSFSQISLNYTNVKSKLFNRNSFYYENNLSDQKIFLNNYKNKNYRKLNIIWTETKLK